MSIRDIYEQGFDEECGKIAKLGSCPECSGTLRTADGETGCVDCGLVVGEQHIDYGPEWSQYHTETNRKRTGAPVTPARHDRGISSEIGYGSDANGTPLSGRKRGQIARLRRQHGQARFRTTAEQNLGYACGEIARIVGALDLTKSIREEASAIFRRAQTKNLILGRSVESIAAASVYAACRCRGSVRTLAEVVDVARCTRDNVSLGYRILNAELGLDSQVIHPNDRIPRLVSECGASNQIQYRAVELGHAAERAGLANGRNPSGIAAACVYLAGKEDESEASMTQVEVAKLAGVSAVTLRERYHELQAVLNELSNDCETRSSVTHD